MSWIITGTEANPPLLDAYPGAAAAYSLRQLQSGSYPVVRVRRDNDDAEQDFTATEISDGTLAAWVGAGNNGFVRTWYDQSGNGNNTEQATAGSQPKIIDSSGGLVTENGKAALDFNGTSQYLNGTLPGNISQPSSFIFVIKPDTTNDSNNEFIDNNPDTPRTLIDGSFNNLRLFAGSVYDSGLAITTAQSLYFALLNGAQSFASKNGIALSTGDAGTDGFADTFIIGKTLTQYYDGKYQELIIYPSDQSANRAAIEANINAHYNIF